MSLNFLSAAISCCGFPLRSSGSCATASFTMSTGRQQQRAGGSDRPTSEAIFFTWAYLAVICSAVIFTWYENQASAYVAARRTAASLSPPVQIGNRGFWTGFGLTASAGNL